MGNINLLPIRFCWEKDDMEMTLTETLMWHLFFGACFIFYLWCKYD